MLIDLARPDRNLRLQLQDATNSGSIAKRHKADPRRPGATSNGYIERFRILNPSVRSCLLLSQTRYRADNLCRKCRLNLQCLGKEHRRRLLQNAVDPRARCRVGRNPRHAEKNPRSGERSPILT